MKKTTNKNVSPMSMLGIVLVCMGFSFVLLATMLIRYKEEGATAIIGLCVMVVALITIITATVINIRTLKRKDYHGDEFTTQVVHASAFWGFFTFLICTMFLGGLLNGLLIFLKTDLNFMLCFLMMVISQAMATFVYIYVFTKKIKQGDLE